VRGVGDGVPQRRVPRIVGGRRRRLGARLCGHGRRRGKLDLIRDITRLHKPQTLAGLGRNVSRVSELDPLLLEIGDLLPQSSFGSSQLFHLGALRQIGADRTGDGERQQADNRRQDCGPPRGQATCAAGPVPNRRPGSDATPVSAASGLAVSIRT
jgi:hypothetical protein